MYIVEDMIDLGLEENQKFPTKAHRKVAQNVALGNPLVVNRDQLTEIVGAICAIPNDQIRKVRFTELPPVVKQYIKFG